MIDFYSNISEIIIVQKLIVIQEIEVKLYLIEEEEQN